MFGNLGYGEILLILLVVLLLFGAKRIPEMAQGLGRGIREFRKSIREVQDEVEAARTDSAPRSIAPATDQAARQAAGSQAPPPAAAATRDSPQG